MKTSSAFWVGIVLLLIGYGIYTLAYNRGYDSGSYDTGIKKDKEIGQLYDDIGGLRTRNEQLSRDYQSLRSKAIQYLSASQQAQYAPLNCTSTNVLNTTYTNCY